MGLCLLIKGKWRAIMNSERMWHSSPSCHHVFKVLQRRWTWIWWCLNWYQRNCTLQCINSWKCLQLNYRLTLRRCFDTLSTPMWWCALDLKAQLLTTPLSAWHQREWEDEQIYTPSKSSLTTLQVPCWQTVMKPYSNRGRLRRSCAEEKAA